MSFRDLGLEGGGGGVCERNNRCTCMDGWMDVYLYMDKWMDGRMDGWMGVYVWMDGRTDGWMHIQKLTSDSLIDPPGHFIQNLVSDGGARDGGGEELPIALRVQMSTVERQAVLLHHKVIPAALHAVDRLWHEPGLFAGLF